ncbi:actin-related protein 2/3 complex subunit 5 family protein [Acetobacter pasteurianus]|nr:actin-related protein 2/3 complex subunit 5 family protein [Acetobacter pasteurianus]
MSQEDWRRIDIDALEPENHLTLADLSPDSASSTKFTSSQVQSLAQQIRSQLSSGQFQQALQTALDNPPYVADSAATKQLHAKTVFETLCSIKNNNSSQDISSFVKLLNQEQQDVLIKYLYRSMSEGYGQKQGGLVLNWFEKTVEITGVGAIARYMTDRRTV